MPQKIHKISQHQAKAMHHYDQKQLGGGVGWGGTDVQATEDCCLLGYSTLRITSLQGGTAHRELGPSTSITNQGNEVNLGSALPH